DAVNWEHTWEHITSGSGAGHTSGLYGDSFLLNSTNPQTQQESIHLDHFTGLWPSGGKVMVGLWIDQNFTMRFTPMINTRTTAAFVCLSSATSQRPRHQVYSDGGSLILDEYETVDWQGSGDWIWYCMVVALDAGTSQLGSVDYVSKRTFTGPVRTLSGTPNKSAASAVDVFAHTGYWTSGWADEVLVAHPDSSFSLADFLDDLARGSRANGQPDANASRCTVTDDGSTANSAQTLSTGAERASWLRMPNVTVPSGAVAHYSTDDGASWSTAQATALPAPFDGLMYWTIPLGAG